MVVLMTVSFSMVNIRTQKHEMLTNRRIHFNPQISTFRDPYRVCRVRTLVCNLLNHVCNLLYVSCMSVILQSPI